jgi:hypothetical protein
MFFTYGTSILSKLKRDSMLATQRNMDPFWIWIRNPD